MNVLLRQHLETKLLADAARPLTVAVAYADTLARHQALELCLFLSQAFGEDLDFEWSFLSFSQLSQISHPQKVTALARAVDLVIVSAPGVQELLPQVKWWLEALLARKEISDKALAILLGSPDPLAAPACASRAYLQNAARKANAACFTSYFQLAEPQWISPAEPLHLQGQALTPLLERSLRGPPPSHWGINE